ncbi:MAG TPA: glutamate racemase [Candidatus Dormibacteraeota bacterium]|nr:glutamate racemase [Candidatus Dormibacteraeota bacterium]
MKIGVFDSGVGGLSVANALKKAFRGHEIILREDKQHLPYGTKSPEQILGFIMPIFQNLIDLGCDLIVVACNTVSTTLMDELSHLFRVPLVGTEPMIQPAVTLTKSGIIAVCATPTTLASKRYSWLKETYAKGIKVLEPDCSDWAYMIEHKAIDQQKISSRINKLLHQNADVIVLGCTHYHWIEAEIKALVAGKASVIQPESLIIKQVKQVLKQLS